MKNISYYNKMGNIISIPIKPTAIFTQECLKEPTNHTDSLNMRNPTQLKNTKQIEYNKNIIFSPRRESSDEHCK